MAAQQGHHLPLEAAAAALRIRCNPLAKGNRHANGARDRRLLGLNDDCLTHNRNGTRLVSTFRCCRPVGRPFRRTEDPLRRLTRMVLATHLLCTPLELTGYARGRFATSRRIDPGLVDHDGSEVRYSSFPALGQRIHRSARGEHPPRERASRSLSRAAAANG